MVSRVVSLLRNRGVNVTSTKLCCVVLLHTAVRHPVMGTVRIICCFVCRVGRGGREEGHTGRTVRGKSVSALQRIRVQCYRVLFLASCCSSFLLHVIANLICIFLVSGLLVLLSSAPKFLHSFCGQQKVYGKIKLLHDTELLSTCCL